MSWTFSPFTGKLDATLKASEVAEGIAHADLSDMPDAGGTITDHDARYYTETEIDTKLTDGTVDHVNLSNKGTNTHAQIDTHVGGDGSDHADVATNTTHSTGNGADHADVASNTTHRGDNSQAHTDYLINNGDDTTSGRLTATGGLTSGGNVLSDTDDTDDIGSEAVKWNDVWGNNIAFVKELGTSTLTLNRIGAAKTGVKSTNSFVTSRVDSGSTGTLNIGAASFPGQFAVNKVFSIGGGTSTVNCTNGGAVTFGTTYDSNGYDAVLSATGYSSFVGGYSWSYKGDSEVSADASAAFVWGYVRAGGQGTPTNKVEGRGAGSFNQGFIFGTTYFTGSTKIGTSIDGDGAFAQGYIKANKKGSPAGGAYYGKIYGINKGTFSQGYTFVDDSATFNAYIKSSGKGAFAQGFVKNGCILSGTSVGSFAQGYASAGYKIQATGQGSFAQGSTTTANIVASATNAAQFGSGTNALADSLQIGTAGLRLKGTSGAPGTLQNGDIWVNGNYVYIRSNGVSCKVVNNPL